jgi:large subunit ribosomal protein L31e
MEKVYVIPLRRAFRSPRTKRAAKAIRVVRAFLQQHMKTEEIRIGKSINESVWARGIQKVPRKIRVHADKDENGIVYAEMLDVEIKFGKKKEVKEEKKEAKKEEPEKVEKKEEVKKKPKPAKKKEEKPADKPKKAGKK